MYVAITRAEDTLLLSGHHWGSHRTKPRGPSEFLREVREIIEAAAAAGEPCGVVEQWAPAPGRRRTEPVARQRGRGGLARRPAAGSRRDDVERGAGLVAARCGRRGRRPSTPDPTGGPPTSTRCWPSAPPAAAPPPVALPAQLSVSSLVELGRDPAVRRARLRPPAAGAPDPHALLGTAFHDWVQRFYGAERLFDLDDLPGAVDARRGRRPTELAELQAAFTASPWAARTPVDVEVPFEMVDRRHAWCAAASTRCSPTPTAA